VIDWFAAHYESLRAAHLVAVVAWMAGLMYLPRLYVYHSTAPSGGELDDTLKVMERRLFNGIMTPSLVLVWALGASLIAARGGWELFASLWFQIKFASVLGITLLHGLYGRWLKAFASGGRPLNHVAFRILNEAPFVLMIVAVTMVVLEPN
jgi:putative membrane protein